MSISTIQNFYKETITRAVTLTGATNIYVSSLPTPSEGYVVISPSSSSLREIVYYTAKGTDSNGTYLTVTLANRGLGGTTAQTHTIGEPVRMNVTAEHIKEISDALDQIMAAGAQDASTTTKGITKLSVAPVSATEPIAVGTNDPRMLSDEVGDLKETTRTSKTGWLSCDGSAVSRSTYSDLFNIVGTRFGSGDGSTTFNLPNLNFPANPSLISYWKFDETSGSAYDIKSTNTLTNNATTLFAQGKINNGADLEASSSQYFSIANASQTGLGLTGNFSFSCWVKLESAPSSSQMVIASKWKASGDQKGFSIFYKNNGGIDFSLQLGISSTGADQSVNGIAQTLTTGTWYHIVYVWTASTHSLEIFVNGASIGTTTDITLTSIFNNSANFQIGHDDGGSGDYFDGMIDEVAIWNTTITSTEVSQLYNSGAGRQLILQNNFIKY